MKVHNIFLLSAVSFLGGVFIHSFLFSEAEFFHQWYFAGYLFILSGVIIVLLFRKNIVITLLFTFILFLLLGVWRYQMTLFTVTNKHISYYNNQKVKFSGTIKSDIDKRIDNIKFSVETEYVEIDKGARPINGQVLVTTGLYPRYNYGDRIRIYCQLRSPEPFEDFAYDRYLARYGIYSLCYYPTIEVMEHERGSIVLSKIYSFKSTLKGLINRSLPEPQTSLFSAIFLGVRRTIPNQILDQLRISGTAHLIAISGLHISIMVMILMSVAPYFYISRSIAFYLITLFLIVYLLLIGFPPSAVRAGIMGWLAIFAKKIGRLNSSGRALVIAAAVMTLINPRVLRDDIGFQLSFFAVIGISYITPILQSITYRIRLFFGIKEVVLMSLAAQLATMPLVVYYFETLSFISPLTNVLVVPFLSIFMSIGLLAVIFSLLLQKFSVLFFFPIWLFLTYVLKVVEVFSKLPFFAVTVAWFPIWLVIIVYVILFVSMYMLKKRMEARS